MNSNIIRTGSILAFFAVLLGAFGAHVLEGQLSAKDLSHFHTATRYQMYHALGILILGSLPFQKQRLWAAYAMIFGTVLFSGSLYLLVFSGLRWWGAVTPLGGLSLLLAWGLAAWSAKQT